MSRRKTGKRKMSPEEELEQKIKDATNLEQLIESLQGLLAGPYQVWTDGRLISIKVLVETVNNLRFEIRHREHAPPHFHVSAPNLDAVFGIESGNLLDGQIDPRHLRLIKWWHEKSKDKLVEIWNSKRPTDCPVGPIRTK